jgi:CRISPR system Cascade subunit CasC
MGHTVIDVHLLRTVPPSNLNRGDAGSQLSASYGGVRRARVCIEQCSYVVRAEFGRALVDSLLGERTRHTGQAIAEPIMAIPPGFRDQASAFARTVLTAANLVEDESKETHAWSPAQRLSAAWAVGEGGRK